MVSLQQLRYLVAIAETLHFRRAAEKTNVTQPTLSGQLRELEERLGVQLVERSRAKVVLTPIGREITSRAQRVLRDVNDIVSLAKQDNSQLGGTIRLGVLPTLGPYLLPHILPRLHASYPQLKIYVREGMPKELLGRLDEGRLDLVLFPLPLKGGDIVTTRLFREPLWIVAPCDHALAAKEEVERSDLRGEIVLALEQGHRLYDQVRELCEQYDAKLSLDYEGTSLDTIRQMVGMGMGLSFMPALYVASEVLDDDQVIARRIRGAGPFRLVGMAWRKHSARQEEYRTLADIIRKSLKGVGSVSVVS